MKFNQKKSVLALFISVCSLFWTVPASADTDLVMAEGVVRKIDAETRKITIKHGEIKNLEMPGMTMVFRLQDSVSVDKLQTGDKVLFHAEKINGAFVITELTTSP
jgi:Cu(I)/Ag(I) efflux system periplasmic protein CusF